MQIDTFQEYNSTRSEGLEYTALIFIGVSVVKCSRDGAILALILHVAQTNDLGVYFSGFQYNMPSEEVQSDVTIDDEAACVVQQVQRLLDMGIGRVVVLNTT
jgi:hypothetical protein